MRVMKAPVLFMADEVVYMLWAAIFEIFVASSIDSS